MAAPSLFGTQFLVNVTTSGGEDSPAVAALANGTFVVAWEGNSAGNNDGFFRLYHADGSALTGELPLNTSVPGNQGRPAVAALTNGQFVVTWRDDASGSFDIKARVYNSDGTPAGAILSVSQGGAKDEQAPAVAALAGGGFVVTWTTEIDSLTHDIYARAYNSSGTALGNEFYVIGNSADQIQPAVTGLTNGNYVIAYANNFDSTALDKSGYHIAASILSGNGTPAGPQNLRVNTFFGGDQTEPSVIGLDNGNFVVTWTTPSIFAGYDIVGRILTAAGGGVSGELTLSGNTSAESQSSLAARNGQFFVSWVDTGAVGGDGNGSHIGANIFANSAATQSGAFLVNTKYVIGNQSEPSTAVLADGRVLFVWTDSGATPGAPDTTPNAVYGQIFDPRTGPVSLVGVGLLNDEWVGTGFGDAMDGAAGNDRIDGRAGNDKLFGGPGNDTLIGGTGADAMRGDSGDDTYFVDNAGDVVDEASGSGTDMIWSAISFSLADVAHAKGDIEKLVLNGTAVINGTGNGLANTLVGNVANNTLNGGGGGDIISGGLGSDKLFGKGGKDIFVFADALGGGNVDKLKDYEHKPDSIFLDIDIFAAIGPSLGKAEFFEGKRAHDGNDHIIRYGKNIFFDVDGKGGVKQVLFAKISKNADLDHKDFMVGDFVI